MTSFFFRKCPWRHLDLDKVSGIFSIKSWTEWQSRKYKNVENEQNSVETAPDHTKRKHIKIQQKPEKLFCEMSYFKSPYANKLIV